MVARSTAPTVLVADADPSVCRVVEARFAKDNRFSVASATQGVAALQAALAQPFDALLWDMHLRDTFSLLPRLRALCPRAVLFVMTTDDQPMPITDLERLDVTGTVIKPFHLDTLMEQVQTALNLYPATFASARIDLAQVGQQLSIVSADGTCVTRVLETGQDTFAVVSAPRVTIPADFAPGRRVLVQVSGKDGLYSFGSKLVAERATPVPVWELQLPRTIRRRQRRRYPRLPLQLAVTLRARREPTSPETPLQPAPPHPETNSVSEAESMASMPAMGQENGLVTIASGTTEDLSLGGCALISAETVPIGTLVFFALQPAGLPSLGGQGRVMRAQRLIVDENLPANAPPRYHLALQFTSPEGTLRRGLRTLLRQGP